MKSLMLRCLAAQGLAVGLFGAALAQAPVPEGFAEAVRAFNAGDYATALEGFRRSATEGNSAAQNNLGLMYANGWGVPEDDAEAIGWYRKAADQGNIKAMYALSVMYSAGEGVPRDDTQAMMWRIKAAEGGDASAQQVLGTIYRYGVQGFEEDLVEAVRWYRLSAAQGNLVSQRALAWMYSQGIGVPADLIEAYVLWSPSVAQGDAHAISRRDELTRRMTPDQLAEAQRRLNRSNPR